MTIVDTLNTIERKGKTVIRITPSSVDEFQKCPRSYYYSYVKGIEPIARREKLDKGSFVHMVLEAYYKEIRAGAARQKAYNEARGFALDIGPKSYLEQEDQDIVLSRFEQYHITYLNDGWIPLYIEEPFSKVIYEDETLVVLLEGKIDLVIKEERTGEIYVIDHKSGDKSFTPTPLSNQFEAYCIGLGVQSVMKNFFGFQKDPALAFKRSLLSYAKETLEESKTWFIYEAIQQRSAVEGNIFPPRKKSCFFCDFSTVCARPRSDRDFHLDLHFKKKEKHSLY